MLHETRMLVALFAGETQKDSDNCAKGVPRKQVPCQRSSRSKPVLAFAHSQA